MALNDSTTEDKPSVDVEALIQELEETVRDAISNGKLDDLARRVDEILDREIGRDKQEGADAVIREVRIAVRSAVGEEMPEDVESLLDRMRSAVRDAASKSTRAAGSVGSSLRDRIRATVDTVRGTGRASVLMVRVNAESRERMDQLIEAGLVGSRSEAAAYLIAEGIKSREDLFVEMAAQIDAIRRAKEELQKILDEKR